MPELPDIVLYIEAIESRVLGKTLERVRLGNPFLLRTASPPIAEAAGKKVVELRRIGKRIAIGLDDGKWLVFHLMIAGRLHWREAGAKLGSKNSLAALDFDDGTLVLTEAGSKRRASLYFFDDVTKLDDIDPGGLEVMTATLEQFSYALLSENHTLKRALTDPRRFSGIGNAYSDEILFDAKLSPAKLTQRMTADEVSRLYFSIQRTMNDWTDRLRAQAAGKFPEKVTAFHKEMAVHGRYGLPCVRCGSAVQRIRYTDNETNYCAECQTEGKLLSDRAMARLLGKDWPKTLDQLELLTAKRRKQSHSENDAKKE